MNRMVVGALAALLLAAAGVFWWQGRAAVERGAPPPEMAPSEEVDPDDLPSGDIDGLIGPAPPEASEATREQRRFARFDRNGDRLISRNELLSSRTRDFRKLDTDHNNLLTFEEWAVATGNRFRAADRDGNLFLTPAEFATTKPKQEKKQKCRC